MKFKAAACLSPFLPSSKFPTLKLFTEAETFGDWNKVQKDYFGDGGVFDQIYKAPDVTQ